MIISCSTQKVRKEEVTARLFDWEILNKTTSLARPVFLSGGIGPEELHMVREFLKTEAGQHCYAVDLNSKFESQPGLKNIEQLEAFFKIIKE